MRCAREKVFMRFFEAVANIFRIPDLRKRLLFALGLLAVYRIGGFIPIPGVDWNRIQDFFPRNAVSVFVMFDLFSVGMFRLFFFCALGIRDYISSPTPVLTDEAPVY